MAKRLGPWMLFVSCLLLLGVGTTSFGVTADRVFLALRFTALLMLSVFVVRRKFRGAAQKDRGDALLDAFYRWARDE